MRLERSCLDGNRLPHPNQGSHIGSHIPTRPSHTHINKNSSRALLICRWGYVGTAGRWRQEQRNKVKVLRGLEPLLRLHKSFKVCSKRKPRGHRRVPSLWHCDLDGHNEPRIKRNVNCSPHENMEGCCCQSYAGRILYELDNAYIIYIYIYI